MDHCIEAIDHELDRRRRLTAFPAGMIDTRRQARKACCRLQRQAVHAPAAATVTEDLQMQTQRGRSVQEAIRQDEDVSQRHDAESDQH